MTATPLPLWILLRVALLVPHFCYAKTATPRAATSILSARNDEIVCIFAKIQALYAKIQPYPEFQAEFAKFYEKNG